MATILDELETIRIDNGGVLKPQMVVEYARDPASTLHSSFEWDDSKAADQYRLRQASKIIRVTVTVLPGQTEPVRAYVSLLADRGGYGDGYRALLDVLSDDAKRAVLLDEAKAEMQTFKRRYKVFSELAKVFAAMDDAIGVLV
jgi:hypothetical protein